MAALLLGLLLTVGDSRAATTNGTFTPVVSRQSKAADTANVTELAGAGPSESIWSASEAHLNLGRNTSIRLSVDLSSTFNDNIFLSQADEVSDTIFALTPGITFEFGRNSQWHGDFMFADAFTRYADETAPDANLWTLAGSIGYERGRLNLGAEYSYRQIYQNSQSTAGTTTNTVNRSNVTNISLTAESPLTAKTTISVGVNYYRNVYETPGLIGSEDVKVPLNFNFAITPKVSLSTGFSYGTTDPIGGDQSGKDFDFNLGARGQFTPKLGGKISVGYLTREVGDLPKEKMLGFDGALSYEFLPNVQSNFIFSHDFGTGTQGSSLQTSAYTFDLQATLTPQWVLSSGLTYRRIEYGDVVFGPATAQPTSSSLRADDYWEANLQASYYPAEWLRTSLQYTLSSNHSTQTSARYSNNLLNLLVGWQY